MVYLLIGSVVYCTLLYSNIRWVGGCLEVGNVFSMVCCTIKILSDVRLCSLHPGIRVSDTASVCYATAW
jgi:hypothetical protein